MTTDRNRTPVQIPVGANGPNLTLRFRHRLTPVHDDWAIVLEVPRQLSGATWVDRFPTSTSTDDLASPFREGASGFIAAMRSAGATVTISATLRPPERAFLMHWSWRIINDDVDPRDVPEHEQVNIRWDHADANGAYDSRASIAAARAMINAYGMQNLRTAPALNSRHIEGNAIDISVAWQRILDIQNADGTTTSITTEPRTVMNTQLRAVGATYGVIKYRGGDRDKPHWSNDGR